MRWQTPVNQPIQCKIDRFIQMPSHTHPASAARSPRAAAGPPGAPRPYRRPPQPTPTRRGDGTGDAAGSRACRSHCFHRCCRCPPPPSRGAGGRCLKGCRSDWVVVIGCVLTMRRPKKTNLPPDKLFTSTTKTTPTTPPRSTAWQQSPGSARAGPRPHGAPPPPRGSRSRPRASPGAAPQAGSAPAARGGAGPIVVAAAAAWAPLAVALCLVLGVSGGGSGVT